MTVFVDHVAAPWVLLLTYQPLQFAPLSCLIATWLRIAIFETIGLGEMVKSRDAPRRLWFAINELDALGRINGLKDALARLRNAGGAYWGFSRLRRIAAFMVKARPERSWRTAAIR